MDLLCERQVSTFVRSEGATKGQTRIPSTSGARSMGRERKGARSGLLWRTGCPGGRRTNEAKGQAVLTGMSGGGDEPLSVVPRPERLEQKCWNGFRTGLPAPKHARRPTYEEFEDRDPSSVVAELDVGSGRRRPEGKRIFEAEYRPVVGVYEQVQSSHQNEQKVKGRAKEREPSCGTVLSLDYCAIARADQLEWLR